MLHRSFKPAKCKTALKLATSRIKLMKNKKDNHLKQLKRELAQLLESGQDQTARIRVEHVVREEKTIAAYDLLDIYCELIVARLPIIDSQKNCPIDLKEAVTSVVFAAPRCADIPELQDVRKHFTAKYGKEFVTAALELRPECGVSRMLVEKLSANAPDGQTKLKILTAIAEDHNVEWDPKTFGAKESKPYDDLLKGPNTFDTASNVHSQRPIVQAPPPPQPNVHAPHQQNEPVNNQKNFHSPSSQSFASPDSAGSQSAPSSAPQHPPRPSGTEYERTEIRHSHSRDKNAFSMGRQNWNMEFKDATAAAQAAAESAERASMAARAAAELSTRERFTRQESHESHKSNAERPQNNNGSPSENFVKDTNYNSSQDRNQKPNMRTEKVDKHSQESHKSNAERPRKNNGSPSENFVKDANYNLSQDRTQKPNMRTEKVDKYVHENHYDEDERHYKEDHGSAKRFSQSASSSSRTDSVSVKEKRPVNNFHEVDRYSEKSTFKEEVKQENSASLSGTGMNKQSSPEEDRNSYYRSSSSDDEDDTIKSPSHQNVVFDDSKDPFDSYLSDNDVIKFDKQPQYDEQESSFYSESITREKSNHFAENIEERSSWENTSGSFKQPLSASRVSAELFSPAQFDESSPKAPSSAHPDDLAPATFDNSSGPSSDSEDEHEKSSFRGKLDPSIRSYKETDFFRNSNYVSEDQGSKGSYFTENNDVGSRRKQNLLHSSDDKEYIETTHRLSPQSSRVSSVNKLKNTDDFDTSVSTDTVKSEVFDQSSSESGMDLKFTTLTGGLRNKGYKAPPYMKSSSGGSLSSKRATENIPNYTQNAPGSPTSSLSSRVGPKVEENSSETTRFKKYDMGADVIEEMPPQKNLQSKREHTKENSISKTRVKNYDLGIDDSKEEIPKPKLAKKQERKEDYTKSKFSVPAGFFDSDENDSHEDLPKRPSTVKVRAESGVSRRTKANLNSETSFQTKTKRGSPASASSDSVSENRSNDSEKHSITKPNSKEKQKPLKMEQPSSPMKTATSSSVEAPSRESSLKKASHVHPNLPDYDSFAAHFQSLRQNRG